MTIRFVASRGLRRAAVVSLAVAIAAAVGVTLRAHWRPLLDAVGAMAAGPLALAFVLCVAHRLVNAHGWTMVLRALGHPMPAGRGARIWLASEACRWLPGSVWSYGSRGVLAARAGVPPVVAAVSMVWELILTVLAWSVVAVVGVALWEGPVPSAVSASFRSISSRPGLAAAGAAVAVCVVAALGSKTLARRLAKLTAAKGEFGRDGTNFRALIGVLGFYIMMAALNGLTFWQVVRAAPGGDHCPVAVVLAANSVAWLVGLFALFAPGGLVVREASIGVLLSGWLPVEQALTAALAWRAVQVAAEVVGCLVVARWGLDRGEAGWPGADVLTRGTQV